MNLQQLEYALALRRFGSYSRAAKAVGISQPAMSIQVKKLEEEIGIALFDRSQRKVKTSPEGEIFMERAQLLVTQARQLRDLAQELSQDFSGDLTVGIIPTLAPYLLPLFVKQFNENFPNIKLRIKEATTEEIVQGIKSGELDGGVISTPVESKTNFMITPLFYESFLLFVSDEHPLARQKQVKLQDIPIQDIWLLREGNCLRDQIDNICEITRRKQPSQKLLQFESTSIESLCRIVEYKGGVTFLPELTTLYLSSEREEMIKTLSGPKHVREISMIHLPNHIRRGPLEEMGKVIRQNIPKGLLDKGNFQPVPTNRVV